VALTLAEVERVLQAAKKKALDMAVPIKRGNELIGAIGVSGARSEEDEEIAHAGTGAL
jgi:hypothetical protein